MTRLLLTEEELAARGPVAAGPLRPLSESLGNDLERLMTRDLYFPKEKALLSREGGRCAHDGALLDFDPFNPHEHRCPVCDAVYRGELHDRFWIYWYQLWLAERAVHGAVMGALGFGDRYVALAESILRGYADRYATFPNVDNVLGPTRLFFSTYLESIWLLQICIAVDLMGPTQSALADVVRDRIVEPSREIIAAFDEGGSNRQVWNDVALLAAARLLGDERAGESAVFGASGLASQLTTGLLADGTWFEGENYHLFAHRGLWYGVTLAERAGFEVPRRLVDRFQLGFAAPFATALPDFTLPSRRDSQYAISLRQWRIAEHCELGLARADDSTLVGALARMYCDDVPRRDTGRSCSAADVERNAQPTALSRADLSWRALLCARAVLPDLVPSAPKSALLEQQGIGVFRRDAGRVYVALDYGVSGGGHGHPDRLNLLFAVGETRWLDDFGTGSYVDPSLHWYRSTLAHNAPVIDGHSQQRVDGTLTAFDERDAMGWIGARAEGVASGVATSRSVIVMPSYLVDELEWSADADVTIDLPLHAALVVDSGAGAPVAAPLVGGDGLEDGYRFVYDSSVQHVGAGATVRATAVNAAERARVWSVSTAECEWWSAVAPGPPARGDQRFRVLRARGRSGVHRIVWSWANDIADVDLSQMDVVGVRFIDGTRHEHRRTDHGWRIEVVASDESRAQRTDVIELAGSRDLRSARRDGAEKPSTDRHVDRALEGRTIDLPRGKRVSIWLGEQSYRRSEQTWREAGEPRALVNLVWNDGVLLLDVEVPSSDLTFVSADAVNRYDNEPADVNGDGVQVYLRTADTWSGWMLVPVHSSSAVRVRPIEGWKSAQPLSARWERTTGGGYRLHVEIPSVTPPAALDVIVNEMPRGRERRRGQLVLSGGANEFVYLRGDRHERTRLIPLHVVDG